MGDPVDLYLKQAEITMYFERAGKNTEGEPLYLLQPFVQVQLGPSGGGETLYKMPIPTLAFLGEKFDRPFRMVLNAGGPDLDGVNFFGGS